MGERKEPSTMSPTYGAFHQMPTSPDWLQIVLLDAAPCHHSLWWTVVCCLKSALLRNPECKPGLRLRKLIMSDWHWVDSAWQRPSTKDSWSACFNTFSLNQREHAIPDASVRDKLLTWQILAASVLLNTHQRCSKRAHWDKSYYYYYY